MTSYSRVHRRTQSSHTAEYDVLSYTQACAGVISTNADATAFWLDDAQQAVLANEHGNDASPLFMGGTHTATQHSTPDAHIRCGHRTQRIPVQTYSIQRKN